MLLYWLNLSSCSISPPNYVVFFLFISLKTQIVKQTEGNNKNVVAYMTDEQLLIF